MRGRNRIRKKNKEHEDYWSSRNGDGKIRDKKERSGLPRRERGSKEKERREATRRGTKRRKQ